MTRRPLSVGSAGDASAVRASAAGVPNTVETPTAIGGGAGPDVSSGAAAAAAISDAQSWANVVGNDDRTFVRRSEEHTSELQSPCNLVWRLLLEKNKHVFFAGVRSKRHSDPADCSCEGYTAEVVLTTTPGTSRRRH